MVGLTAPELTQEEQAIIQDYPFGGFILFGHNCAEPLQILTLCGALWKTGKKIPPFIAIDEEGGRVHRLPEPFTHFPAARLIGRAHDPDLAYQAGRATAIELALVGINLNFGPVLDVNSNPRNPVIGDRSFGSEPREVITASGPWTQGLRDGGIIPCGKHFPGHGDTGTDSHVDLPVVKKPLAELETVELPPFVNACRQRIESLMTAHVVYPSVDAKLPATLSYPIIDGLLRSHLGYRRLVFGDDMEMKAITDHYEADEVPLLSVGAGVDVLLYGHELSKAVHAFEVLYLAAERDNAIRDQVEASYRRIEKLKRRFLKSFTGVAARELTKKLSRLEHQRIVDKIHGSL